MSSSPRKFNPGLNQSDEELIRQFVVRHELLDQCVRTVIQNTEADSNQHLLFYGPRGRGKTMLMARVEAEIRRNTKLFPHWMVVRLFEEAHYNIATPGELWLVVLEELARSANGERGAALAQACREIRQKRGDDFERSAIAVFNDTVSRLDKQIVLIVENLQDLTDDISPNDAWTIRNTLQNQHLVMLIATATSHFHHLSDANHAFFELLDATAVTPLNREDAAVLWNYLSTETRSEKEIRPLQIMTGGSPRLLVMMAQFAKQRSLQNLMDELIELIDERTDYFKSQIESLPPKERRIFIAMADLWDYCTAKEIADAARTEVAATSALLNRLEKRGALDVDATEPRKKRYAVTERLTCMYYQLRSRRDEAVLAWQIVNFARAYYSTELFEEIERDYVSKYFGQALAPGVSIDRGHRDGSKRAKAASMAAIAGQERLIEIPSMVVEFESKTKKILKSAWNSFHNGDYVDAIAACDTIIDYCADAQDISLREQHAMAVFVRALTIGQTGDHDGEIEAYNAVIDTYADAQQLPLREVRAEAMFNRAVAISQTGDHDGAIAAYEAVIDTCADAQELPLREVRAEAMFNRALAIRQTGDHDGAIAAYDAVIDTYADAQELPLREQCAKAMFNRASAIGQTGDHDSEIEAYDAVIDAYADAQELLLREQCGRAMLNRAAAIGQTGDHDGEIDAYDAVIDTYADAQELPLREQCAEAMFNRASAIGHTGDHDGEIDAYDILIDTYADAQELPLREVRAEAMFNRAFTIGQTGDHDGAIDAYDAVIDTYANAQEISLRGQCAKAMFNRAFSIEQTGDYDRAINAYDAVIDTYADAQELPLREVRAEAMFNRASAIGQTGDHDGEIDAYDAVIDTYADAQELPLREQCAEAMFNRAFKIGQTGDHDGEIDAYDAVIDTYADAQALSLREVRAEAVFNRAFAIGQTGDHDGAIDAYDAVIDTLADAQESPLRELRTRCVVNQALTQLMAGPRARNPSTDLIHTLETDSIPRQVCKLASSIGTWGSTQSGDVVNAVVRLAHQTIVQPDHEAERMTLTLGIAALLPAEEALNIINDSGAAEDVRPVIVHLQRQLKSSRREVFELAEIADDVGVRVAELREELYQATSVP